MLVECFYALEDFVALGRLMDALPDGSALLANIGEKFQSVGLCQEGVVAFLKVGRGGGHFPSCVAAFWLSTLGHGPWVSLALPRCLCPALPRTPR